MSDPDLVAIEQAIQSRCQSSKDQVCQAHKYAADVAKKMCLVLHGGAAIHMVLPEALYDDDTIPDLDVFSSKGSNSKKTAHAAAHLIMKKGIEKVRVVPAIHKNTHSIRIGRDVLMDVSWISQDDMRAMNTVFRDENNRVMDDSHWKVAPVAYLKLAIHLELYRPAVYIERWRKIWPRLKALYAAYPKTQDSVAIIPSNPPAPRSPPPAGLDEEMTKAACIVVGKRAVSALTGEDMLSHWPVDYVLPSWPEDDGEVACDIDIQTRESIKDIVARLCRDFGVKCTKKPGNIFRPPCFYFTKDDSCVARLFLVDTEVCTAIEDGVAYGTSDVVLHLLYGEYLEHHRPRDYARILLAMAIDAVVESQDKHLSSGVHQRFNPFNKKPVEH